MSVAIVELENSKQTRRGVCSYPSTAQLVEVGWVCEGGKRAKRGVAQEDEEENACYLNDHKNINKGKKEEDAESQTVRRES